MNRQGERCIGEFAVAQALQFYFFRSSRFARRWDQERGASQLVNLALQKGQWPRKPSELDLKLHVDNGEVLRVKLKYE